MNPFPGKNSILVMDNTKIHHDEEMINLIKRIYNIGTDSVQFSSAHSAPSQFLN